LHLQAQGSQVCVPSILTKFFPAYDLCSIVKGKSYTSHFSRRSASQYLMRSKQVVIN
jgi:hypothetical protein